MGNLCCSSSGADDSQPPVASQPVAQSAQADSQPPIASHTTAQPAQISEPAALQERKQQLSINQSSIEELQSITSVGPVLAKRIVDGRPYATWDDVRKLKGVGQKMLEKLQAHADLGMTVGGPASAESIATAKRVSQVVEDLSRPSAQGEMRLASWNLRNLGNKRGTDAVLHRLAGVLSQFDLVAVQELRDLEVVQRLLKLLPGFQAACSEPVGAANSTRKEIYGFLWRTSKVSALVEPKCISHAEALFVRTPFVGYFKSGEFDFILCSVHIVWGKSKTGRRKEVTELSRVLEAVTKHSGTERDIILLGDFNMEPSDPSWQLGKEYLPLINSPHKTTVGDISLFDNFWLHSEHTAKSEWTGRAGVFEFDKHHYPDTPVRSQRADDPRASLFEQAGRRTAIDEVSDHRPIWAVFSTLTDDDAPVTFHVDDIEVTS